MGRDLTNQLTSNFMTNKTTKRRERRQPNMEAHGDRKVKKDALVAQVYRQFALPIPPSNATKPQAASPHDRPWEEEEPSPEKLQLSGEIHRVATGAEPPSENQNGGDAAMTTTWREILARYRRGWPGDDDPKQIAIARTAYAKLIANGVPPADILAGVIKWVEAADAPRFLPSLIQLLTTRTFEQSPPIKKAKRKRGAAANGGGGKTLPRTNGNKVDVTKVALMQAGYIEDENGNLHHPDGNASSGLFWLRGATP
jgi:hypothetical protein